MLLGMFPYDHTEHPDPNSSDAHMEVRGGLVKQAQLRGRTSEQFGRGAGSSGLEAHAAGYVECAMWKAMRQCITSESMLLRTTCC